MRVEANRPGCLPDVPWIWRFPVRTPTLPPATHTNVYVLGTDRLVVVDPASPEDAEQAALAAWLAGRDIDAIVLTHHHADHVGGVTALAQMTGARVLAHRDTAARLAGRIPVDGLLDEGDVLRAGAQEFQVLHTPGHAPGHLCLLDTHAGALVAGDMVASIGTIVIDPPEGDMRLYLASLDRLGKLGLRWLLPAHGTPIDQPATLLAQYVGHRLWREAQVMAALGPQPATLDALVVRAYADVPAALHPLARRSLLAHLDKLCDEQRAVVEGQTWRLPA